MIEKRILGRTGITVGEVGLGCEGFASVNKAEALKMIDAALENGMNFIDIYASNPVVRNNIGYAIKGRREQFVLQGHIGSIWENNQYKRTRNIDECKVGFEDLLTRLDTDYVDVGMIHYCDAESDYDAIFNGPVIEYAKELKKEGKIKHIGLSTHNPVIGKKAAETGLVDVIMFSINPCYDLLPPSEDINDLWADGVYDKPYENMDPVRCDFYETCERLGVAITVMKVFAGGDLLNPNLCPFGVAMTSVQCIHYTLTRPGVAVSLSGGRNLEEILDAAKYGAASDEEKDFSFILSVNPKFTFQGHCMYCGHCAPCSVGIDIAAVNKFLDLCIAEGFVAETVLEHYNSLSVHGGDCLGCGQCEKNCPFDVAIIDKMIRAKEVFGK